MTTYDVFASSRDAAPKRTARAGLAAWTHRNVVWISLAVFYLVVGAVLVFKFDIIMTDAISRVANASYVIRGREPHLAAVGFVWTPLPSLLMLPLLPLHVLFPALLTSGFAANVTSAVAMSAAIRQMHLLLKRSTLDSSTVWMLTLGLALQPVTVFYGANGMSEALEIFGLLLAAKALIVWLEEGITTQLVVCGIGVAIGYLSRYEAGLSFVGVAVIVALVSYRRAARGHIPPMSAMRLTTQNTTSAGGAKPGWIVLNELLLVGLPSALAFVGWAAMSWIVTGSPFAQLTSEYGVSEFVKIYRADGSGVVGTGIIDIIQKSGVLQPFGIAVIVAGLVAMALRRERTLAIVTAVLAPALLFNIFTMVSGRTLFIYRYLILVIPIVILAIGSLCVTLQKYVITDATTPKRSPRWVIRVIPIILFALTIPMTAKRLYDEEHAVRSFNAYALDSEVATYLDSLHAPEGSILTDSGTGFGVLLHTDHPSQFIITSDADFRERVADLSTVKYILVPENTGLLKLDAINRRWPSLFQTGPAANSLVKEWKAANGRPAWRLYTTTKGSATATLKK